MCGFAPANLNLRDEERGESLHMKEKKRSVFRYFGRVTKDLYTIMPWEVSAIILLEVLEAVAAFLQVSAAARFFDTAGRWLEGSAGREELLQWAGLFVVTMGLPMLCSLIKGAVQNLPMFEKHHDLIVRLHNRVASVPLIRLEEPEFHNEVWRAKMCVYNTGLLNYFFGFIGFLPLIFRFVGTVWVIAAFHIYFVPLALLSIIPSVIVRFRYQREQYSLRRSQTAMERRKDYLWEVLTGRNLVKELRTMETENYIKEKWEQARDSVMDETFRFEMKNANRFLFGDLFKFFGVAASIGLSISFTHRGLISLGQFAACLSAFGGLQVMAESMMNQLAWQKGRADFAGDYYDFFDNEEEKEEGEKYPGLQDTIEARDVSFHYPGSEKEALSEVSFTIRRGERVVIVGENGSGKTTLSKVIAGIYRPEKGRVLYDGKEVGSYAKDSFYKRFSVIQQNFMKYQFTVRENIGISQPSQIHNDERLMKSAEAAGIEKAVKRAGGLDAQLGREFDGVELSGGEWQKLAIARGLNKDAEVILLDEPTSALDPLVEYDILTKFLDMTKGKTSVIISHRIGLGKFADRIIVMKNGRMAESGTHDELLAMDGEYCRMWHEQAKWYQ